MTSRQIQTFLTVAETLNFTEAAERLYSSQPSISRNISLLEEELGFKLFERGNNYVTLTQSGAIMAQGGISRKLFDIFAYIAGKKTAGVPCAVVVTCLFYGAISGSGPATTGSTDICRKPRSARCSTSLEKSGLLRVNVPRT